MENGNFGYPVTDLRNRITRWATGTTPLPSNYLLGESCDDDSHRVAGVTVRYASNNKCVLCDMAYQREHRSSVSLTHYCETRLSCLIT